MSKKKSHKEEGEFPHVYPVQRVRVGLWGTLFGYFVLLLGAKPAIFGLDRSPVIGFIQTATFLVGIGIIALCGYLSLMCFWPKDSTTITADFGLRFVASGFAIALFCAMADVFGFGTHPVASVPFFGRLQSNGVEIGEAVIALGLVMMIMPPHSTLHYKKEDTIERIDMSEG